MVKNPHNLKLVLLEAAAATLPVNVDSVIAATCHLKRDPLQLRALPRARSYASSTGWW